MSEWKASVARVVLFSAAPTPSPVTSPLDLYRNLWGEEPETFHKQPNPLLPTVAQGKRGGLMANCLAHPGRLEFVLRQPPAMGEPGRSALPLIEDSRNLHSELLNIVEGVGRVSTPNSIIRIALVVQFLCPMPTITEANSQLTATIPGRYGISITDEEDFIFQVNIPYASRKVEGVRMNSIRKWSVDRIQVLTMAIPTGGVPAVAGPHLMRPQTASFTVGSVVFDINSLPGEEPLSIEQQSSLLGEALVSMGQAGQEIGLDTGGPNGA